MPSRQLPALMPNAARTAVHHPVELVSRRHTTNGPRVMFYSHDTYGLGHLRRTLALAQRVETRWPTASQLIVAGAAPFGSWPVPSGADWIKLPAVVKRSAEAYEARTLDLSFRSVSALRSDILLSAARHFQPQVLVVDHVPNGLRGEAVQTLRLLRATGAKLVLGMRDVLDEPAVVRAAWERAGVYELLDDVYDRILVYGTRDVCDVVTAYGLSESAAVKTRFVGYLGATSTRERNHVRADLGLQTTKLVLVTAGGGGDGAVLLRTMLEGVRARGTSLDFDCLVVAGPLMPASDREELERFAGGDDRVQLVTSVDDLADYVAAADAIVAMGGYNTTREILTFGRPAVIVPRVEPRKEQLIRAKALARRGLVRCIHPDELTPSRLLAAVDELLATGSPTSESVPLGGLDAFVEELDALTSSPVEHVLPHERAPIAAAV